MRKALVGLALAPLVIGASCQKPTEPGKAPAPTASTGPRFVEGGRSWWVVEFANEADLRGWHPSHAAIKALALGRGKARVKRED